MSDDDPDLVAAYHDQAFMAELDAIDDARRRAMTEAGSMFSGYAARDVVAFVRWLHTNPRGEVNPDPVFSPEFLHERLRAFSAGKTPFDSDHDDVPVMTGPGLTVNRSQARAMGHR